MTQANREEAPEYPRLLKVLLLSLLFLAVAHCRGIIQMQAGSRPLQVLAKHLCGTPPLIAVGNNRQPIKI